MQYVMYFQSFVDDAMFAYIVIGQAQAKVTKQGVELRAKSAVYDYLLLLLLLSSWLLT